MPKTFAEAILAWHKEQGRHDLPWQHNKTRYSVWVSEVMLQQTQVATVIEYFNRFMQSFPNVVSLANASEDEVLAHWSGLGYYSRARNLHKAAKIIRDEHAGVFPAAFDDVVSLPGVGPSTAGAILSLADNQRHSILDGNVKRVLSRVFAIDGDVSASATLKTLWALADQETPVQHVNSYNQAMMDLGATLCTRSKPVCGECPVAERCQALLQGRVAELPRKKSKREVPTRQTYMLILENEQGEWLLEKRPPSGIWGGLWSFPEKIFDESLDAWLAQKGFKLSESVALEPFMHVFSHFRLEIHPILAQVVETSCVIASASSLWYKVGFDSWPGGMPAPLSKVLLQLQQQTGERDNDTHRAMRQIG